MNYGFTDALAPFPLHSLVNVMSATINNNTVSFNVQETRPLLLRMVDPEELVKFDCVTPTTLDYLAHYDDALCPMDYFIQAGADQSPIIYTPADVDSEPHAREGETYGRRQQTWWSYANNVLAYDMNRPAGTSYYHKPRGSWRVNKIYALDGGNARVPLITDTDIYIYIYNIRSDRTALAFPLYIRFRS